ncbi:MAG: serine hydrolase [Clostridia bacterium]|nr:serine hydrolase [Clostridia bacterium]
MKKNGWHKVLSIAAATLCMVGALSGCTGGSGDTDTTATTTTTVPTTTRTTGTPTTIYASSAPELELSSPTGERPDAEIFERLAAICKANKDSVSLYYKDLETGYTITYREDEIYQAASVIKAPYVKYLLASETDWSKELTMTTKQGGSKYIDNQPTGTKFTVGELMEYTIRYSDNTAYYMLNKEFDFTGFNAYAANLGIRANKARNLTLKFSKPRFGYLSAYDVGTYMEDIARYIDTGTDSAKQLYSWMITTEEQSQLCAAYNGKKYTIEQLKNPETLNAAYNVRKSGYTVAHKYGEQDYGEAWNRAYHDGAIVWRDHPYVLAITSTLKPHTDASDKVFHDVAALIDQMQTDWYK